MRGEKIFCIYGCFSIYVISTEVENHIFKPIEFLDTSAFINNQHWQSSEILIFLCKYDIVISETLVGFFLDVHFLLLAVILSELHEKPRRKDWVKEKIHRRICVRDITFLTARCPFYVFLLLFLSTPSHFPSDVPAEWPL